MHWVETIANLRNEVFERLESECSDEGLSFIYDKVDKALSGYTLIPNVTLLIDSAESLFPGKTKFGATAILHFTNATEGGRVGNIDVLVSYLCHGVWAAVNYLGMDKVYKTIGQLDMNRPRFARHSGPVENTAFRTRPERGCHCNRDAGLDYRTFRCNRRYPAGHLLGFYKSCT